MSDQQKFNYKLPNTFTTQPVMVELLPEFAEAWIRDFSTTWPTIVKTADVEEFHRFGHTIKGSFLQFGFPELSKVGGSIMKDSEAGDWATASKRISGLLDTMLELKKKVSQ